MHDTEHIHHPALAAQLDELNTDMEQLVLSIADTCRPISNDDLQKLVEVDPAFIEMANRKESLLILGRAVDAGELIEDRIALDASTAPMSRLARGHGIARMPVCPRWCPSGPVLAEVRGQDDRSRLRRS